MITINPVIDIWDIIYFNFSNIIERNELWFAKPSFLSNQTNA